VGVGAGVGLTVGVGAGVGLTVGVELCGVGVRVDPAIGVRFDVTLTVVVCIGAFNANKLCSLVS
jgi:hypothetical protein